MATVAFDVEAVRRRYSALQRDLVLLDGPGGTQVPDEVIDAISTYLRDSNANLGGPFETSERTVRVVDEARAAAGRFLGSSAEEVTFGANMTSLSFALSRTAARTWEAGDEIVVTRLDHDGNVAPWLELAHDLGLVVRFADITDDCDVDLADLEGQLSDRTRVVAFPIASNAVGTLTDVRRIVELAHGAGALAWADAVHAAPHVPDRRPGLGRRCPPLLAVQVLRAAPRRRLRPARGRRGLAARTRSDRSRTSRSAIVSRRERSRSSCWPASSPQSNTSSRSGGRRSRRTSGRSASEFLAGLPSGSTLYGRQTMEGRVPTFMFTLDGIEPDEVGRRLGEQGIAVWPGNYYALEVLRRLGLEESGGAVRAGFVHYNTHAEVDRLLDALAAL